MPCGLFSLDIGAKNARKIVFIASTRKSVFAAAALAIGGSIAKGRAPPVCGILSVRGFRDFSPTPHAQTCRERNEGNGRRTGFWRASRPREGRSLQRKIRARTIAGPIDEARFCADRIEGTHNRRDFRSRRSARKVHA